MTIEGQAFSPPSKKKSFKILNKEKRGPNRYCAVCSQLLTGKQLRFCSDAHRSVWWNELRARAVDKPKVSEDPELQELFENMLDVLIKYTHVLEKYKK